MTVAIIAENTRKELMIQFCIAYAGILAKHEILATRTTGKMVADATGLNINCLMPGIGGGEEQIAARCAYNEIDLVLLLRDPTMDYGQTPQHNEILKQCDMNNIPVATSLASAEVMVLALDRGDLDWREIVNPTFKDGKKK